MFNMFRQLAVYEKNKTITNMLLLPVSIGLYI